MYFNRCAAGAQKRPPSAGHWTRPGSLQWYRRAVFCRAWLWFLLFLSDLFYFILYYLLAARRHQARLLVCGEPWSVQLYRVEKALGGTDYDLRRAGCFWPGGRMFVATLFPGAGCARVCGQRCLLQMSCRSKGTRRASRRCGSAHAAPRRSCW